MRGRAGGERAASQTAAPPRRRSAMLARRARRVVSGDRPLGERQGRRAAMIGELPGLARASAGRRSMAQPVEVVSGGADRRCRGGDRRLQTAGVPAPLFQVRTPTRRMHATGPGVGRFLACLTGGGSTRAAGSRRSTLRAGWLVARGGTAAGHPLIVPEPASTRRSPRRGPRSPSVERSTSSGRQRPPPQVLCLRGCKAAPWVLTDYRW